MFRSFLLIKLVLYANFLIQSLTLQPRMAHRSMLMAANTISFHSPVETRKELPSALYLPGLDGIGNYSLYSFSNFSSAYNLHRMEVSASDRSSFIDVAKSVIKHLKKMQATCRGEEVLLIGESFGGLLASYVAARTSSSDPDLLSGCALINPATS